MVWLIGCKGMLGREVAKQLSENKIQWVGSDKEVDITNLEALDEFTESHDASATLTGNSASRGNASGKITWVINCAGYTAVDNAESNQELAKKLNEDGARNIARAARRVGAKMIHISTDYVFDGTSSIPYTEEDVKNPQSVYGLTKAAGEDAVQKEMTQYYILRTSWLYGFEGKNFVYTMTKLMNSKDTISVVNDQKGSPTCAVDLATVIIKIIVTSQNAHSLFGKNSAIPYGLYQFTNEGETSWYNFAQKIKEVGKKFKRINQNCTVNPCSTEEYPTPAKRPAYSTMSKEKIKKALKIKIPSWESSLENFMKSERFNAI